MKHVHMCVCACIHIERGMMQEKMISHFFTENHNGCSKDMSVQIIDHCDPNDKERRESYWIETLETSYPKGLNYK